MNITVNPIENTLRFIFESAPHSDAVREQTVPALIDIGQKGRLIGIEIGPDKQEPSPLSWSAEASDLVSKEGSDGPFYLAIESDSTNDELARSVAGFVRLVTDDTGIVRELILPRKAVGYEITYPSGNR